MQRETVHLAVTTLFHSLIITPLLVGEVIIEQPTVP